MPIFTYFAITGPVLLALVLALSAYLEPEKAPTPTELLAIGAANAHSGSPEQMAAAEEESDFSRLNRFPLTR
jgi:hypothetical protein